MYTERLRWVRMINFAASKSYHAMVSGPVGLSVWCGSKGLHKTFPEFMKYIEEMNI